jgi:hypothetical protein
MDQGLKLIPIIFRFSSGSTVMFNGLLFLLKTCGIGSWSLSLEFPLCLEGSGEGVFSCVGGEGTGELLPKPTKSF